MSKKIKAEKSLRLDDGQHDGKIIRVEDRSEPFQYVDIIIQENTMGIELRCGVPAKITEFTTLGKILNNFKIEVEPDEQYDVEELLAGKQVRFLTKTEKTDRGEFARIIPDTLKPL